LVLVFDLDGVVYLGDTPIPGAVDALNALGRSGHRLYYLTNNSTRSRQHYAGKLSGMGVPTTPEQVMTSAYATGLYLRSIGGAGKKVFVVGEWGLCAEMEMAGLEVIPLEDPTPVDFVVAGLDRELTFAKLRRAHEEITVHRATFVATNRDATYPMETGTIPGGGAIVAPIETSTGVRGATIGKPEPGTWRLILELEGGASPSTALMVGDRPETDIMGAKTVGLHTALTLTGVTTPEAVAGLPEEQRADHVLADLTELPSLVARLARH
jgi:phosphoglycolate/pyridoxal phosphate phosphatase family enzyme